MVSVHRKSKDYMLVAGLWCANQKPPTFACLEPLFQSLKKIKEAGNQC